jgi:crotonobetainyl-CoA:carnitine CoA-transferase CaiB-like acyl-CoA transferase
MSEGEGALAGIRVLDLTRYIPGPYCTMLLGDLGANVVKIEEPFVGDPTRAVPPPVGPDTAAHAALNRNKRSVVVDLRTEEGVAVVRRLASAADVLVESFRPGVLEKRGLGAETLRSANPRLVYCSLTGYGQGGPLAARAGHDIDYAALSGLLGTMRDGEGRPILPTTQLADMAGGLYGAIAILAALQARERTGHGQVADVSMFQSALALMTLPLTRLLVGGAPVNELSGAYACYNVYRCRDGRYLAVGALEPKFWEALCRSLGRPELVGRQWESGATERRETIEVVARVLATRARDDWVRELSAAETCVEAVMDMEESAATPHGRGFLSDQRSGPVSFRTVAPPLCLSGTPASVRRPAPALGEHTDEILGEVGLSTDDIERLRGAGVIA